MEGIYQETSKNKKVFFIISTNLLCIDKKQVVCIIKTVVVKNVLCFCKNEVKSFR